jgi:hypothetical protein
VPLHRLIRGEFAGGVVTLHAPQLTFRLDHENNLLTKLPSFEGPSRDWPEFRIVDGKITFQREGGGEAVFSNICGTVRKDGDHIIITGVANDSEWGEWKIACGRGNAKAPFEVTLHTAGVRLTPEMLRRVPFVPPVTWEQVTLDGETPVNLKLKFGGSAGSHYRVALAPKDTTVQVHSIDLTARSTFGMAVVEDGVVTLTDVNGKAAGGTLHIARSVMDFRGLESVLRFNVSGDGLNVRELPANWGLPAFDGRMTGKADLTVKIHDGQVRTSAGGDGVIEGFLSQKLQVKMRANERGYRFDITNQSGAGLAPEGRQVGAHGVSRGSLTHTFAKPRRGDTVAACTENVSPLRGLVLLWAAVDPGLTPWATVCRPSGAEPAAELRVGARNPLAAVSAKIAANGPFPVQQTSSPPPARDPGQAIRLNLGLKDVSLAELVQKLDLKLPIHLDGRLTFNVKATIPLSDARDLKAYHATGTIDLPWARIEDLWLQQVKARLTFENGVLRLDELTAHEPNSPPAAPPTELLPGGTILGTSTLGVLPLGDLTANVKVNALPIGPFLRLIPHGDPTATGTVDGQMSFKAPAGALKDMQKWQGSAQFTGKNARLQNIPADKFTADLVLRDGAADIKVKGETLGGTFDLNGRYPSSPDQHRGEQGRIDVRHMDLARLADAYRSEALRPLAGRLDLNAQFNEGTGGGSVTLSDLAWGGKPLADRLGGTVRVIDGAIRLDDVGGELAGGTVRGRIAYDYRRPERSVAVIRAERVDARTLLAPFTDSPPLEGPLEIRLVTRLGREWTGAGQVVLSNGKLFGVTIRDAQLPLGWAVAPGRRGELRLHDATAQAARGRMTGQAELKWGYAARLNGQIRFTAIDAGELLSHYTESQVVCGLASGRIDFGGRDMHSARDLTARVDAKLAQAMPSHMPVFRQVMPMILPGVGANVQFQSGDLRGTLGGGVFHVERLTLVGDVARIYAEGIVTLQQRLDLNMVANTNQLGIDPAALQLLGVTLPTIGPIPLGAMNQAVSYLSNRTISLRVTGTIRAPVVQVNPVPFLTETAVRFFIAQAGVPVPSAVLQAPGP